MIDGNPMEKEAMAQFHQGNDAEGHRLQDAFGQRLRFVGLQGSRARGEAGPESDIDAVVILDDVALEDLRAYRALLKTMPEREKVCGFYGGQAELARWDRGDLFQFIHDTIPFYGDLSALTPPLGREDARRAALTGACNIYHGCVHNLLFERDADVLYGLYKTVGFALRAKHFWQTGAYISKTDELAGILPEGEARLLTERDDVEALVADGEAFEEFSRILFAWAGETIRVLGGANANDT